jgi:hypothetical protein
LSKRGEKTVSEYLGELRETSKDKPPQVKEALEVYIDLWETAIKNETIKGDEGIEEALTKLDAKGGLYRAAQD